MNLIVFTDGGSRGNPGNAAIGVIAYMTDKQFSFENKANLEIAYEYSGFIGQATNNEAEYQAIINAIKWISTEQLKYEKIVFYLDSKLVVEQINKNWKIKDERMKKYAHEFWKIAEENKIILEIIHVRREFNSEADALVNQALDNQELLKN
ncbi:ribonuclease HI family protein [Candidatus Woesebacteria bacterium]|nr:ribonuclease HI family protein [Candidatus Woesebacteria bacterium]